MRISVYTAIYNLLFFCVWQQERRALALAIPTASFSCIITRRHASLRLLKMQLELTFLESEINLNYSAE